MIVFLLQTIMIVNVLVAGLVLDQGQGRGRLEEPGLGTLQAKEAVEVDLEVDKAMVLEVDKVLVKEVDKVLVKEADKVLVPEGFQVDRVTIRKMKNPLYRIAVVMEVKILVYTRDIQKLKRQKRKKKCIFTKYFSILIHLS